MTTPININYFCEGATALRGISQNRYFHLVNPSALQDITSIFYQIIPSKTPEEDNSHIFIECSDNHTEELKIYRKRIECNAPNLPPIRYTSLEGSLVELSSSDREKILEKTQTSSLNRLSGRSK